MSVALRAVVTTQEVVVGEAFEVTHGQLREKVRGSNPFDLVLAKTGDRLVMVKNFSGEALSPAHQALLEDLARGMEVVWEG